MKKYGLLIGLVVLLLIAVYVNVRINKAQDNKAPATASSAAVQAQANADEDYFEVFRQDRKANNDKMVEYLETIINNKSTAAEQIAEAQKEKLAIVDQMDKEFSIESQLKAKGFADVAADVKKGTVTVVIKADGELSSKQAAQVYDIVNRITGEPVKNIKIMPSRAN